MSVMSNFVSAMLGVYLVFGTFSLAITVLMIIAKWKLYDKAGEPGWAALIPYYKDYVLYKISWGNGWFFLLQAVPSIVYLIFYIPFLIGVINNLQYSYYSGYPDLGYIGASAAGFGVIVFLFSIAMLVINIITMVKLAKVFGKDGGWACGLIFLPVIFFPIMGFSKDIVYHGIPGKMPPFGNPGGPGYNQQGYGNPYQQGNYGNPGQNNYANPYQQQNPYQQPFTYQNPYQQHGYQNPQQPIYGSPNYQQTPAYGTQASQKSEPDSPEQSADWSNEPQDKSENASAETTVSDDTNTSSEADETNASEMSGTESSTKPPIKYCTGCGAPLYENDKFCPRCGTPS